MYTYTSKKETSKIDVNFHKLNLHSSLRGPLQCFSCYTADPTDTCCNVQLTKSKVTCVCHIFQRHQLVYFVCFEEHVLQRVHYTHISKTSIPALLPPHSLLNPLVGHKRPALRYSPSSSQVSIPVKKSVYTCQSDAHTSLLLAALRPTDAAAAEHTVLTSRTRDGS